MTATTPRSDEERWPTTLRRALTCWWGLLLVLVPLVLGLTEHLEDAIPALGVVAAAALLGTLAALAATSVLGRRLPPWAHVLVAALAVTAVMALMFLSPSEIALTALATAVGATIGLAITAGRPTWRRYVVATVASLVLGGIAALLLR